MKCCICSKVALYHAGDKGFCKDHKKEAIEAQKSIDASKKLYMRKGK